MNDRDLDRAIDTAARQMVQCNPSRSLGDAVMSRAVEGSHRPRWSFVVGSGSHRIASATAAVVACAVLLTVVLNRAPEPASGIDSPDQTVVVTPPSADLVVDEPLQHQPVPAESKASVERPRNVVRTITQVPRTPALYEPPDDAFAEEASIVFESIAPAAIVVPRLQIEAGSVDKIQIEPISVEPLTAAND
jgi:hypothetical protein